MLFRSSRSFLGWLYYSTGGRKSPEGQPGRECPLQGFYVVGRTCVPALGPGIRGKQGGHAGTLLRLLLFVNARWDTPGPGFGIDRRGKSG